MEPKKIVMIALVIITLTGINLLNASTHAEINEPITISNLDYLEYEYVLIPSNQEVNLSYITSDYTETAVTLTKTNYYPIENETKYQITSNHITPDHTFTPGTKNYIYQDTSTGQLYNIKIDYNSITPPISPTTQELQALQTTYQNLQYNYTKLQNDTQNYTRLIQEINNTLTEYNDSTIVTMQNKTIQLYQEYQEYHEDYQEYYAKYTSLYNTHSNLTKQKNDLQTQLQNMTILFNDLNATYQTRNQTLNQTTQNLTNTRFNLSKYEAFIRNLHGTGTQAYLGTGEYEGWVTTPYYYNTQIEELENANGMIPLFIIVSISITLLLCLITMSIYIKKLRVGPMEYDQMKYLPTSQKYDNFIIEKAMRLGKGITHIGKNILHKGTKKLTKKQEKETDPRPTPIQQKNEPEPKTEMNEKIDRLLAGVGSVKNDMGTMKKDLTGIHDTIDDFGDRIETLEQQKNRKNRSKPSPKGKPTPA